MFKSQTCGNCFETNHYYQKQGIVPPCPKCGHPELKTSEQYLKSMGVAPKDVEENDIASGNQPFQD